MDPIIIMQLLQRLLPIGAAFAGGLDQQRAQEEARRANEARYTEGLTGYDALYNRVLGRNYGGANRAPETTAAPANPYQNVASQAANQFSFLDPFGAIRAGAGALDAFGNQIWNANNPAVAATPSDQTGNKSVAAARPRTADPGAPEPGTVPALVRDVLGRMEGNVGTSRTNWENLTRDLDALFTGRTGRLGTEFDKLEGYLEGAGAQERRDIDRAFAERGAANQADLTARGLGGTSIVPSVASGNERYRADAIGGLEERIRQQRLGLGTQRIGALDTADLQRIGNLSGMQQQGFFTDQSNIQNLLSNIYNLGMVPHQLDIDLTNQRTGWIGGRTDTYPQTSPWLNLAQGIGQGIGPYPQPQASSSGIFGPALGGLGAGLGAGAGFSLASLGSAAPAFTAGKFFSGFCIDGNAMIETANGRRPLRDIKVGDFVQTTSGKFKRVKAFDFGTPHAERAGDYIRIDTTAGSLTLTTDHIIGGRPAGELGYGDALPGGAVVKNVRRVDAVPSGDLLLEDGSDYLANGLPVGSMIARLAITEALTVS